MHECITYTGTFLNIYSYLVTGIVECTVRYGSAGNVTQRQRVQKMIQRLFADI